MRIGIVTILLMGCYNLDKGIPEAETGLAGGDSGTSDSGGSGDSAGDSLPEDSQDSGSMDSGTPTGDADGDGSPDAEDCDDTNPAVYPGAEETCGDGVVNDCSTSAAEAAAMEECYLPAQYDVADSDGKMIAESSGDDVGWVVSGAGDVNGDGRADIVVGAPDGENGSDDDSGVVYLVLGPVAGDMNLSGADARLVGEASGDNLGASVGAGDVDEDDVPDLVVGAYREDTGGDAAGAAYVVYGPALGDIPLSAADVKIVGSAASDYAGKAISSSQDVGGDGSVDMAVGASGAGEGGEVYVFHGPVLGDLDVDDADATVSGEASGDSAGESLAMGDFNMDGVGDMIIGATGNGGGGAAYLVLGPVDGDTSLADAEVLKLTGGSSDDVAGVSVALAEGACGPGVPGALVGATDAIVSAATETPGSVYLFCGITTDTYTSGATARFDGTVIGDQVGYSVAGAGDVNGDSYGDILVGSPGDDTIGTSAGMAYLLYGPVEGAYTPTTRDIAFAAEHAGDLLGSAVAGPGDVDADGLDDLLIGAAGELTAGSGGGAAYLILGASY